MRIKYLILLVVVFGISLFVQEPTPESFFPHAEGNIWEYRHWSSPTSSYLYRSEIIKDSLGSDSCHYLFLSENDCLYKIDTSNNVYMFPQSDNWLIYKLDADSGDMFVMIWADSNKTIPWWICRVEEVDTLNIFGEDRIYKVYRYYWRMYHDSVTYEDCFQYEDHLASGIGKFFSYLEDGSSYYEFLEACVINGDTMGILSNIEIENEDGIPNKYELYQNYPNPFNPATIIRYSIPRATFAKITVYNILGQEVQKLYDGFSLPGTYEIEFKGDDLPSGVYLYQLETPKCSKTKKMLLVK